MKNYNVGDLIVSVGFNTKVVYEIIGIYLGAIGQESVVEIITYGLTKSTEENANVPIRMLEMFLSTGMAVHYTKVV